MVAVLIYTDGSFEPGVGGAEARIGGVLIEKRKRPRVFGAEVPKCLLQRWFDSGKQHLVGQVEMYGILVAKYNWRKILTGRRVILFIDNFAVLDCYIPGTSKERTWRDILCHLEKIDEEFPCFVWATRVPSESNVADPPSRGSLEGLQLLGELIHDETWCPMAETKLVRCC